MYKWKCHQIEKGMQLFNINFTVKAIYFTTVYISHMVVLIVNWFEDWAEDVPNHDHWVTM